MVTKVLEIEDRVVHKHGSCPNNPKSFGPFKWKGSHEYRVRSCSEWAFGKFELWFECKHCEVDFRDFGVSKETMQGYGLPIDWDSLPHNRFDWVRYRTEAEVAEENAETVN